MLRTHQVIFSQVFSVCFNVHLLESGDVGRLGPFWLRHTHFFAALEVNHRLAGAKDVFPWWLILLYRHLLESIVLGMCG